jgi:hypothetical protein
MVTNPPFTRDPKTPPFHLRETTPEEMDQWRRLVAKQESLHYCGSPSCRDSVQPPAREEA